MNFTKMQGCGNDLNDPNHYREINKNCTYVELGNPGIPHVIIHRQGWSEENRDLLRSEGRGIRFDKVFPKGANVTFWEKRRYTELYYL